MLGLVLYLLILSLVFTINRTESSSDDNVVIEVQLYHAEEDRSETVNLSFSFMIDNLEIELANICEAYNIQYHSCRQLIDVAYQKVIEKKRQRYLSSVISNDFIQQSESSASIADKVPNSHWPRHPVALQSEVQSNTQKTELVNLISHDEQIAWFALQQFMEEVNSNEVIMIHSSLLNGQNPFILLELVEKVVGFVGNAQKVPAIVILNYGEHIDDSSVQKITTICDGLRIPLKVIHHSTIASFFEIPSIRLIHKLSQYTSHSKKEPMRILYLHTKGVSYLTKHQEIEDWKDFMLYFLLEQRESCLHLLDSKLFDVIGVNYHSHPRALSGNFWWSTSDYIASQLTLLDFVSSDKYSPERWILTGRKVRLYVPAMSHMTHSHQRYPTYCYKPSEAMNGSELPNFLVWREICRNEYFAEYYDLHRSHPQFKELNDHLLDQINLHLHPVRPMSFTLYNQTTL